MGASHHIACEEVRGGLLLRGLPACLPACRLYVVLIRLRSSGRQQPAAASSCMDHGRAWQSLAEGRQSGMDVTHRTAEVFNLILSFGGREREVGGGAPTYVRGTKEKRVNRGSIIGLAGVEMHASGAVKNSSGNSRLTRGRTSATGRKHSRSTFQTFSTEDNFCFVNVMAKCSQLDYSPIITARRSRGIANLNAGGKYLS